MEMLAASTTNMVVDLASMMWVELVMFAVAGVGYTLLNGGVLPVPAALKKVMSDESQSEPERVARELQSKLATGDFLAVYKLWQRAKSFEEAVSGGVLIAAAVAMRQLGRSATEIAAEFKSALECNPALREGEATAELLESLRKEGAGSAELHDAVRAAFAEAESRGGGGGRQARPKGQQAAALGAALRRGDLDDALARLGRDAQLPRDVLAQVVSLAGRKQRLPELGERLHKVGSADTATMNALLEQAARRRDAALCRHVRCLGQQLSIAKDARTYELLARGLAADAAAARALFDEVESQEAIGLTEPLSVAFLSACTVSQDAKLAERVFDAHRRDSGSSLGPAACAALLKAYIACGLHDRACELYEREMVPRQMALDQQLGELLVKSAAQAGRSTLAEDVCAGSAANDASRHLAMVRASGREGNLEGAIAAFRRLQESGAASGARGHNALLDACVQCRDTKQALELFAAMKADGTADIVSFNIAIKLLHGLGRVDEARDVLREMPAHGLRANAVTYNELLNAKVSAGDLRSAWVIVEEMQSAGVRPTAVTCSILLKSLTKSSAASDVDSIMTVVNGMEEQMDEVLFSSVVEACIRVGRLDAVAAQMRRFAAQGGMVALTPQTYGSLFKAYGQARDVERLWELWREMEQRQVMPTSVTVGCFVDALVKNGCAEDALGVVHRLLDRPERASLVNNIIFSTLLKGFAMTKQTERLFAVYAEMRERDVTCNTVTYNTLLDACARCGCMGKAPGLVADMRRAGVNPDTITYSTLVKGHCFSGDIDEAFAVLKAMRTEGNFKPDEILYNSLLDGCAKEHRLQEALDLFATMRAEGLKPSNFTLCTLVKLLGRARRLPQAFGILDELCSEGGLRPNVQVYTCLMTACVGNGQLEKALQLHDQVIASGCQPDQKMYNMLVRGCLRAGSLTKAVEVVRCSYQLPGHRFTAPSRAYGVEAKVLEEVVMRLNHGGRADAEVVHNLVAELKQCRGLNLQDSVYAQVVQRAARGAVAR